MSESFEKWYQNSEARIERQRGHEFTFEDLQEAYTAGLLRAAEIAKAMTNRMDIVFDENTESIADAIGKEII